MGLSALIIGYGSIGKKHAEILNSLKFFSKIYVLTSQKKIPFTSISQIEESLKIDPDYFIISSPTYKHFKQLLFLEKNFKNKKILIEKPLYEKYYNFNPTQNQVWVGYCLRFNPVIEFLKLKLKDKNICNVNVFCGSYLPNWRVESNYLKSYSASKSKGGGVLLDLSHEIDYINWLFGSFDIDYVFNGKISNLSISSDDTLILNGHFDKISLLQLCLNYYTKISTRQIIIDGENLNIKADLIKNKLIIIENESMKNFDFSNFKINDMYLNQHLDILKNKKRSCTFVEGLNVMKTIEQIKKLNSNV